MKQFTAAAVSTHNWIGQPDTAIQDMKKWLQQAAEQGVELALFPELNVTGYIPAPMARQIAESVPGPSTEKIIRLAERYGICIAFGLIEIAFSSPLQHAPVIASPGRVTLSV